MNDPAQAGMAPVANEEALLAALRAGDSAAYRGLIATYGPRLRAAALRLLRNEADANDVVQETFLCAFRSVGRFEGKSQIGTWLHRIAINAALMRIRSRERHPEEEIHDLLPRFTDGGQHPTHQHAFAELPEAAALREEAASIVRDCIGRLPENYRNAILLKDIEDLDYPEVAKALGLTLNATRIRIHRARQALRGLLAPHFETDTR